ncbi:DUF2637 domain-containing protein [Rhodococcoides fascians]|uniref:DUF2637 domain-containing protein n=1 Tax=Rhodococcoides fascians TaxID=1828 RepID=UPI00068F9EF7|nr:DUF2637 domain-containing protein [Rhodococcus fascians]
MTPAKRVAITGIAILLPLALYLSYVALVDVSARSGVGHYQSLVWPIIVDGVAIVATVAAYSLRGDKGSPPRDGYRYSWTLLVAAAIVSAAANAAHLLLPPGPMPQWVVAGVALVPPVAIVVVAHLTVILARDAGRAADAAIEPATAGQHHVSAPAAFASIPREVSPIETAESAHGDLSADNAAPPPPPAADWQAAEDRPAEALRLRTEEGLTWQQIGDRLGISERSARRDAKAAETGQMLRKAS